jgi:glutathione peroxidase
VLDFPCNQFGGQAPGSAEEIQEFCEFKYRTTFPRFAKVKVNGEGEEPLFTYLKEQAGGILGSNIKWNFTKFLVDRQGKVVKRYAPNTAPKAIEVEVKELLEK